MKDPENGIWIGTNGGGVCHFDEDTETFTQYTAEEGVIRDLLFDSKDHFWLATYGGGLKMLVLEDEEVWNFYEGDNGLRSNVILTIHEDQKKRLWVGTKEAGLNYLEQDTFQFTMYNTTDGLPGNEVKGILEDDSGNLWLSTNNGISKFNPENKKFYNYSVDDGLQGTEFNALAYYKDRDGFMYFGGINGFNRFHPDSIKENTFEYPVVFTEFKIFNKTVEPGDDSPLKKDITRAEKIVVPHNAYVLTFDYAALNYNEIKGVRYAYKLEGFEEDWNEVSHKRSITYTNLSPGEYTLKVKAANSDGIWNTETSLNIEVTPPFWQTIWFYLVVLIIIGSSIYGFYNYRMRKIKNQNRKLAHKISERTTELNQRNKELESVLEDLRQTRNELAENAHKAGMADIATGVVHNIGNVLNSIGTSNTIAGEVLNKSKFEGLFKANKMLLENSDQIDEFLKNDPKGKKLIQYYGKLDAALKDELELLKQHHQRMEKKVQLINNVINAQQNYANINLNRETLYLNHILEDTLTIFSTSLERHGITVRKEIKPTGLVEVQKTKLVHVILNLLKNAKEAMKEADVKEPVIDIKLHQVHEQVILKVSDNGKGIAAENLKKIFNQGFTTKSKGHGFGLHSSANYMKEMNAEIKVQNKPTGRGAEFILIFHAATTEEETVTQHEQEEL
jgi:signal transduction histidine kinase/streptogramin lyase